MKSTEEGVAATSRAPGPDRAVVGSLPRRRGRPPGSVSLTADRSNQIVMLLRGGASLRSAAQVAGVPLRTLQGWIARGEGRGHGPGTAKLRAFAADVRRAQAEARISAEVRVHERQPATWLRAEATAPEGSVTPEAPEPPSPERIRDLARRLRDVLLYTDPTETVPACSDPRCRCVFHRERTPEELAQTRGIAQKRSRS